MNSPAATYFHTPEWCACMAAWCKDYESRALGFGLADGTRVILPVMVRRGRVRIGPLARGVSTMPNTYGGPVAEGRYLTEADWHELAAARTRLPLGKITIHATPGQVPPETVTPDLSWRDRNTYRIDLRSIPGELLRTYHKGCVSSVKKGRRSGLTADRVTTNAQIKEYYAVYVDSLKRWGKDLHEGFPLHLFEALHSLSGVEVWCAKMPDGRIVAGGIFLHWGRSVQYWQGAMLAECRDVCPANFLLDHVMEDARSRGIHWFDFNPSGDLKGVEAFKASFGATPVCAPRWTWRNPLLAAVAAVRMRA